MKIFNPLSNYCYYCLKFGCFFSNCASTTLIQSYPRGAELYIDGIKAGTTPSQYTDSKIARSTTNIDLLKNGYETRYTAIYKTDKVNVGTLIGGMFVWICSCG